MGGTPVQREGDLPPLAVRVAVLVASLVSVGGYVLTGVALPDLGAATLPFGAGVWGAVLSRSLENRSHFASWMTRLLAPVFAVGFGLVLVAALAVASREADRLAVVDWPRVAVCVVGLVVAPGVLAWCLSRRSSRDWFRAAAA